MSKELKDIDISEIKVREPNKQFLDRFSSLDDNLYATALLLYYIARKLDEIYNDITRIGLPSQPPSTPVQQPSQPIVNIPVENGYVPVIQHKPIELLGSTSVSIKAGGYEKFNIPNNVDIIKIYNNSDNIVYVGKKPSRDFMDIIPPYSMYEWELPEGLNRIIYFSSDNDSTVNIYMYIIERVWKQ